MKLFKKLLCSFLLVTALLTSVQTTANAATDTINEPISTYSDIDILATGPLTFHHWESGTVVVNSGNHWVYNLDSSPVEQYHPGESFYYDSVYTSVTPIGVHYFASYVSNSGVRRVVQTSLVTTKGEKVYIKGLTIY